MSAPAAPVFSECSATDLLALFRARAVSPVEVAQAALARIDAHNGLLNAFCHIDAEGALAAAAASEARWCKGEPCGPLDGIPVAIKDLVLTRGMPTLRGSRTVDAKQQWEVDAPAPARLREAGAVLLGKTTTPEFGCKGETNSPLTGITRNPWDPSRTSGGSSGGTAAAVAAGMCPLAIGTDGAGSIRIPAAFCGNFGLKPSFGRVPVYPASPLSSLSHLGPHSMNVTDAALMMNVLKQPDARDGAALPPDTRSYLDGLDDGVAGLRIAYSPALGFAQDVDADVAQAVASAARTLEALGAHVECVDPGIEDPADIVIGLWFAGAWATWNTLSAQQQQVTDPDFRSEAEQGARIDALELQRLHLRRAALASHMRQWMQRFDLLVTPAVAVPAFAARPPGQSPMTLENLLGWTPFSYPFNLTLQPACSIPCGLTRDGLPVGLQIVGPMFADALVLRAARAFERAHPIARPPQLRAPRPAKGTSG